MSRAPTCPVCRRAMLACVCDEGAAATVALTPSDAEPSRFVPVGTTYKAPTCWCGQCVACEFASQRRLRAAKRRAVA